MFLVPLFPWNTGPSAIRHFSWDINAKWLCQREVLEILVLAHFMVATEGEIGNEPPSSIWRCFSISAPSPADGVFWRLNSASPGTVCTYICRNNVYVSQNRHSLKAVHLKVKLIEPIFSTRLLTLLMCTLNRRSQIWNQSHRGRSRQMAIFRAGNVLPTQLKLLKRQSWRRCNHFSQRWWQRRKNPCAKAMDWEPVWAAQERLLSLRLCAFVSCLLHGTGLLLRKFIS